MINQFWNLCRACPSVNIDKVSENMCLRLRRHLDSLPRPKILDGMCITALDLLTGTVDNTVVVISGLTRPDTTRDDLLMHDDCCNAKSPHGQHCCNYL